MACQLHHLNKKTGVTYVYELASYWDKEKHQPRSKGDCHHRRFFADSGFIRDSMPGERAIDGGICICIITQR